LGLCDDKYNLNPNIKISASILIALLVLSFDQKLLINFLNFSFNLKIYYLGTLTYFFTILSIILFINALNMIDGMNLQAGSYLFLITLYLLKINFNFYLLFFLILIIFFLYLNFQNRLFLGDNGIYLLGFVFSYFFIYYYNLKYIKYADNIFIIMMIPGIDLLRVFILRIINKKNPFSADRNHIHHYLLNYFSYKKSLFIFLILSSMPFVLSYLFSNNIFSAFFSLLIYFFLLIFLKIKKIKNYYKL
jgi:UDP-GlcNAc:undecaprenyl-phosphate GlcNAc-1-phosphate transferase